ncbi:unnamed protein product [Hymenolepis diminuta]|uniref:Uncharacterized protein n=1 Tax=Hymenolepis diminuta TaxID=6216 RepID=A0A0R3SNT5_HYMDI|nr:unnamed protein product [Hymenolepis diminuta]
MSRCRCPGVMTDICVDRHLLAIAVSGSTIPTTTFEQCSGQS